MWVDLLTSENAAKAAPHNVTRRAEIYVEAAGLPLDRVLDALKISRATWYRRLQALREWESENRAAARRINDQTPAALDATRRRVDGT